MHIVSGSSVYGDFTAVVGIDLLSPGYMIIFYLGFGSEAASYARKTFLRAVPDDIPAAVQRIQQALVDPSSRAMAGFMLMPIGSDFELLVWQGLMSVPLGTTISYGDLAQKIGKASAVRAVASAIGRNPIAVLIPCHRVIQKDGDLGGYHWGTALKRKMLADEGVKQL